MSKILIFFGFFLHFSLILAQISGVFHLIFANSNIVIFLCVFSSVSKKGADTASGFSDPFFCFFANFS